MNLEVWKFWLFDLTTGYTGWALISEFMCQNHRLKLCPKVGLPEDSRLSYILCLEKLVHSPFLFGCTLVTQRFLWSVNLSQDSASPPHPVFLILSTGTKIKSFISTYQCIPRAFTSIQKIASCWYFFTYLSHTYSWIFTIIFSQSKCVLFALNSYSTKRSFKKLFPGHGTSGMWNNISRKTWRFQLFLTKHPMNTNRCIVGIFYCPSKFPYVCLI